MFLGNTRVSFFSFYFIASLPPSLCSGSSYCRPVMPMARNVFVTVGSTRFDKLVAVTSAATFLQLVHQLGYSHLTLQHGKSPITLHTPTAPSEEAHLSTYSYKSSLQEDMESADLIISHAGNSFCPPLSTLLFLATRQPTSERAVIIQLIYLSLSSHV